MQDTTEHAYPTIDMTDVGVSIHALHPQICTHGKRVEVSRSGCEDRCVLISKSELDSLERAVEILTNTEYFQQMCQNIQKLLETAGMVYRP